MMKNSGFGAIAAMLALAPVQAVLADQQEAPAGPTESGIINAEGKKIGTATFEQTAAGVLISLIVEGLIQGGHALHIHEKGACDPADGFKSAGGHFNPSARQHGFMAAGGPHAGDMPNQFAGADGMLVAQVLDPNVTLGAGPNSLADADGSALVIHDIADDYMTQPSGNAGGRLACAVIRPPKPK